MHRLATAIAILATVAPLTALSANDLKATFTLRGIVPVRCDARVSDVQVADAEAVVLVDQRCNTTHQLNAHLGAGFNGVAVVTYGNRAAPAVGGSVQFGGLGFTEHETELRVSLPGKSAAEVREVLRGFTLELVVQA